MAFDILVHITENSPRGRLVQMIAEHRRITLEQAVDGIIDASIATHTHSILQGQHVKSPAETLLGLFSSPEDAALMDEVMEIACEGRKP